MTSEQIEAGLKADMTSLPEYHVPEFANRSFSIKAYDPIWPKQFEAIKQDLEADLADAEVSYLSIEHIGSTSVPGLGSKASTNPQDDVWGEAILDVCIVVKRAHFNEQGLKAFRDALMWGTRQGGYFYIGDGGVRQLSHLCRC